ncbi:MAG: DMT family transporter [Pseudomonadota bacterium]
MTSPRANRRGMIAMVGAMAAYSVSDALTKLASKTLPLGEVLAIRGIFTVLLIGTLLIALGQIRHLRTAMTPLILTRSVFDALSSGCYVAALIHMRIAEVASVVMIAPLILTALSVIFYSENVGWRRWCAVVLGFVGVLFVVKPTPNAFNAWALVALVGTTLGASREILTRRIDTSMPTLVITFVSVTMLTVVGCAIGATEHWLAVGWREAIYLSVAACFFSLATYLTVLAFRDVVVSSVAPFRYTFLIFAGIAGYLAFRELPDGWSMFGAGLIVASGLYALHRETVRRRELTATTPTAQ